MTDQDVDLYFATLQDDRSWLGRTVFGSGLARLLIERAFPCEGIGFPSLALDFGHLAAATEFAEAELSAAVEGLLRARHARVDATADGAELIPLCPSTAALDALRAERAAAAHPRAPRPRRPSIPVIVQARVYARDGFACVVCGATEDLTLDHIEPWSAGGPDTEENLRVLCRSCNSRKGART